MKVQVNPVGIMKEDMDDIIDMIQNTNLSYRAIARKYNVDCSYIIQIKNGSIKKYRKKDLSYPLRKNN